MPYLNCPRCHRTAWVRASREQEMECRHCGAPLDPATGSEIRLLSGAVRERFARDAQLTAGHKRFVRD